MTNQIPIEPNKWEDYTLTTEERIKIWRYIKSDVSNYATQYYSVLIYDKLYRDTVYRIKKIFGLL